MAFGDIVRTAWLDRERARLGLPSREQEAAARLKREQEAALQASNLETAGLIREKTRAEIESMPAEQDLERRLREAQIRNYDEQPRSPAPRSPHYVTDARGVVRAISPTDTGFDVKELGAFGTPQRDPAQAGISPAVESNIINRLTAQWDKANSTVNELKRQRDLMQTGLAAARKGDMAAGSQAVLVTFQKILDPTSVVRESEYARSAAGQALLARIQGAAERLAQGGAGIPVTELEAFAALADQFVQQATTNQSLQMIRGRIGTTADRYRIPHDVIFGVEPQAPPAAVLGDGAAPAPEPETWIEVAPGIRKKVKK